jgi:hypothetical protein
MNPLEQVQIGNTGLFLSRLGLGARGIVDPFVTVSKTQALATVQKALDLGINYACARDLDSKNMDISLVIYHPK